MAIINNRSLRTAVVRLISSTTITLDQLATSNAEIVQSAAISKIYWVGNWTITRGANTIIFQSSSVATTGTWNLAADGLSFTDFANSSIVVTTPGVGTIVLELTKQATLTPASTY